jgi:hypothetical protein
MRLAAAIRSRAPSGACAGAIRTWGGVRSSAAGPSSWLPSISPSCPAQPIPLVFLRGPRAVGVRGCLVRHGDPVVNVSPAGKRCQQRYGDGQPARWAGIGARRSPRWVRVRAQGPLRLVVGTGDADARRDRDAIRAARRNGPDAGQPSRSGQCIRGPRQAPAISPYRRAGRAGHPASAGRPADLAPRICAGGRRPSPASAWPWRWRPRSSQQRRR